MTTKESHQTTVEARRAVGTSAAPVSPQTAAMHRYLTATTHGAAAASTAVIGQRPPLTSAETGAPYATPALSQILVAGIDHSTCAQHAARWAATEATCRHASLHLVHAYHLQPAGASGYTYPPRLLTGLRDDGRALLAETEAGLRREFPELTITTALVYGDPATVLRHASGKAVLAVVGAHGGSRIAVALGSVATEVAETCPVPVAVIHHTDSPAAGPVVVGVDGSPTSREATRFAFETAAARRTSLIAVHCWTNPSVDSTIPAYLAGVVDIGDLQDDERVRLTAELADFVRQFPGVELQQAVIHSTPSVGLLKFAPLAQMIIAGSRGHSGIIGMLLGSTGQALIANASCPVVIVRSVRAH
jgi:nucleotide-binding universal stress UspA family protein